MRAGAYTIHQSLTADAAAVLKLALGLARRRGHAQVTPLHVAFALLTTSTGGPSSLGAFSSSPSPGLLKRACLRSHPGGPAAAHPLQCRALELCFNVALNRLPTSMSPPPHSSGGGSFASSLIQPCPTLSNALVAALKRAQANQRRGCVELQHQQPSASATSSATQQQQQPLLAIKVELDQLVISILDDPSVSRVMREAGFSSATVKTNLEEESAAFAPPSNPSSSPPPPPPQSQATSILHPHLFHVDHTTATNGSGFGMWPAPSHFLLAPPPPPPSSSCSGRDDDVRAVLDVMLRKRGSTCNPVVVGDSASMAESVAAELLRRLERGDAPADLAGAHLLKLHLSYVHVRLMSRGDVDARAAELRRGVDALSSSSSSHRNSTAGLVVFVGDLSWAIHDEDAAHAAGEGTYSPVEHMVAELGRVVDDVRAARGKAWLVATASYQTYMRWQRQRRPAWALQAVLVPTGGGTGLALNNLHHHHHHHPSASAAAGAQPAMATMVHQQQPGQRQSSPLFAMAPRPTEGDVQREAEKLVLCAECSRNFEREASLAKKSSEGGGDAEGPRSSLPAWLVPADQPQHKDDKYLLELKRKWSRLCRKLHLCVVDPPCNPWWSPCMPPPSSRPSMAGLLGMEGLMAPHGRSSSRMTRDWPTPPARWGLTSPLTEMDVGTALALGSLPLSDTASSDGGRSAPAGNSSAAAAGARELERRLRRNVPWQPASVAAEIAEAVAVNEDKGAVWLYVKGGDQVAVRRAAAVIAEAADRVVVVCGDASRFRCAEELCSDVVSRVSCGTAKPFVLMFGDVERVAEDVVDCLAAASRSGCLKDHSLTSRELDLAGSVVILTTAKLSGGVTDVISLRLWSEEDDQASCGDRKRKPDAEPSPVTERNKRQRHDHDTHGLAGGLDLNIDLCDATDDDEEEEEEAVPSDITHEGSSSSIDDDGDLDHHPTRSRLLQSVASVVTLDDDERAVRSHLHAALTRALGSAARVEDEAVEALAAASGHFLEDTLDTWTAEVLQPAAATVTANGGKERSVLVLGVGGARPQATTAGFMGSVLPSRVHVD